MRNALRVLLYSASAIDLGRHTYNAVRQAWESHQAISDLDDTEYEVYVSELSLRRNRMMGIIGGISCGTLAAFCGWAAYDAAKELL